MRVEGDTTTRASWPRAASTARASTSWWPRWTPSKIPIGTTLPVTRTHVDFGWTHSGWPPSRSSTSATTPPAGCEHTGRRAGQVEHEPLAVTDPSASPSVTSIRGNAARDGRSERHCVRPVSSCSRVRAFSMREAADPGPAQRASGARRPPAPPRGREPGPGCRCRSSRSRSTSRSLPRAPTQRRRPLDADQARRRARRLSPARTRL